MTRPARIEANRRNGLRSTGLKTPAGLAATARAATTTTISRPGGRPSSPPGPRGSACWPTSPGAALTAANTG